MAAPFAYSDDVAARWRPLSTAEQAIADVRCEDASVVIRARFPGIDSQVEGGTVDQAAVRMVCANMAIRAMVAPNDGVSQESETVGPFGRSQTYANPLRNVFLTAADITAILGYIPAGGTHSYTNTTRNVFPDLTDLYDGGVTVIPSNPGV